MLGWLLRLKHLEKDTDPFVIFCMIVFFFAALFSLLLIWRHPICTVCSIRFYTQAWFVVFSTYFFAFLRRYDTFPEIFPEFSLYPPQSISINLYPFLSPSNSLSFFLCDTSNGLLLPSVLFNLFQLSYLFFSGQFRPVYRVLAV